ncbi:helix-turn-helix transcriptional regulator [Streptomyces sp.]|uniref:helix-turn-helix domain-containing protein n=1 Tax=Streptomyces sp. TaxID=1931 RepID=UPI0028113908|nr:helix-turn-helix transcriptional regulator [Streptomyces sp.]
MSTTSEVAPGANLALLRKTRGISQAQLTRTAGISVSLLSKIEVGDRTLTPTVAAVIGKALGIPMAEVLGKTRVVGDDEERLTALRSAVRDYDLPGRTPAEEGAVLAAVEAVREARDAARVHHVLARLPGLLRSATTYAHTENSAGAWMTLAEVYSSVYWLAARHRWMDMAELAVTRQRWAVEQQATPLGEAIAARDRAGAYLNGGDAEGGLMIVDRAIARAETALSGEDRAFAVGMLNLRGMTLAGRLEDKVEGAREAERHIASASRLADDWFSGGDANRHSMIFGPQNTTTHVLATRLDLGRPQDALDVAQNLDQVLDGLPPTRVAPSRLNVARAHLDVGNREAALASLSAAWEAAPEMARIHPMAREVFRVLASLHRRSNPELLRLSHMSGIAL